MEIELSPLQKARDYVGSGDSIGAVELLGVLRDTRNQKHPDRFQDPAAKIKAEEEFKKIQELITNLDQFVQAQEAQLKPTEITLYKASFQLAASERKAEKLETERQELEQDNKYLKNKITDLEEQLAEKTKTELESEHEKLRDLYRPKGWNLFKTGLLLALALIIPIFAKVEEVSLWLARYSPFPVLYINRAVFGVFLIIVILSFKKLFEAQFIGDRAEAVLAPSFARSFITYVEAMRPDEKSVYFTESEAFRFIEQQPALLWRILGRIGFRGTSAQANTRLTSFFIDMLLEKKLIRISNASRLDRRFSVATGQGYF
jgi:hypothetical protein